MRGPVSPSKSGATPRGLALKNKLSRSNYTVYVIHDKKDVVISLIIKEKYMQNISFSHVIAQLIGYFATFDVTVYTPLVFVLTEVYIQIQCSFVPVHSRCGPAY